MLKKRRLGALPRSAWGVAGVVEVSGVAWAAAGTAPAIMSKARTPKQVRVSISMLLGEEGLASDISPHEGWSRRCYQAGFRSFGWRHVPAALYQEYEAYWTHILGPPSAGMGRPWLPGSFEPPPLSGSRGACCRPAFHPRRCGPRSQPGDSDWQRGPSRWNPARRRLSSEGAHCRCRTSRPPAPSPGCPPWRDRWAGFVGGVAVAGLPRCPPVTAPVV